MNPFFRRVSMGFLCGISAVAFSDRLLNMEYPPSIIECFNPGGAINEVPLSPRQLENEQKILRFATDVVPRMYSYIEAHYPGATLAFLGRDAMAFRDAFHAFMEALGLSNRILTLDGSSRSFCQQGKCASDRVLVEMAIHHGFRFSQLHQHPFVIIDIARAPGNSGTETLFDAGAGQQRFLIRALIRGYRQRYSVPAADAVRRINGLALLVSDNPPSDASFHAQASPMEGIWSTQAAVLPEVPKVPYWLDDADTFAAGTAFRGWYGKFRKIRNYGSRERPDYFARPGLPRQGSRPRILRLKSRLLGWTLKHRRLLLQRLQQSKRLAVASARSA